MTATKTIQTTTVTNDHDHTYDDDVSGSTSRDNGHTHQYRRSEDGRITILEADGHTHGPASANRSVDNSFEYDGNNLEYKQVKFEIKNVQDDPDFFTFEGFASTFGNVDRGGDTIQRGAFDETLKEMIPKLLWQHQMSEPLGIFTEVFETDEGLFVKAKMPKSDHLVKGRVIPQMMVGSIDSMSIGFNIMDEEIKKLSNGDIVRIIKKIKLFEISLVTIPMNPKAVVTDQKTVVPFQDLPILKNADGEPDTDRRWSAPDAISRVRDFTGSDDAPSRTYRKAFLFFDSENQDNFTAYKLPIADVVDGRLVAIPRAIFASAAAISGARGGVNVSDADKRGITRNINRYYSKMGLESPLEKGFSNYIGAIKDLKEISEFFKTFGFSINESTTLISTVKRIARKESSYRKDIDQLNKMKVVVKDLKNLVKENYHVKSS